MDLSDSEEESGPVGPSASEVGGGDGGEDAAMGRSRGRGGELGVNKRGTPLYSREDIREQYCINDKELQVLDKSQRKSLLGCFSNQGQVGRTCGLRRRAVGKKSPVSMVESGTEPNVRSLVGTFLVLIS